MDENLDDLLLSQSSVQAVGDMGYRERNREIDNLRAQINEKPAFLGTLLPPGTSKMFSDHIDTVRARTMEMLWNYKEQENMYKKLAASKGNCSVLTDHELHFLKTAIAKAEAEQRYAVNGEAFAGQAYHHRISLGSALIVLAFKNKKHWKTVQELLRDCTGQHLDDACDSDDTNPYENALIMAGLGRVTGSIWPTFLQPRCCRILDFLEARSCKARSFVEDIWFVKLGRSFGLGIPVAHAADNAAAAA